MLRKSPRLQLCASLLFLFTALAIYRWVALDPSFEPFPLHRGLELVSQEKFEQATPFLARALERDPADPVASLHLGLCHSITGDQQLAVEYYTQATQHATGELLAISYSNRGWSNVLLGRSREAILDASSALEHVSGRVPAACAYAVRSAAWTELEAYDQALADLERAAALLPESAEFSLHRAAIYRKLGFEEEARAEVQRAATQQWAPTYFYHDRSECPICRDVEE